MSEGETKEPTTRLSRRQLLTAGAASVALVGTGHEIIKGFEGIRTNVGIFIPFYERHDIGIEPRNIPKDINVYFREIAGRDLMDEPAEWILEDRITVYRNTPLEAGFVEVFPDEVLNTLSSIGAEIMVGDVVPGRFYSDDQVIKVLKSVYIGSGAIGWGITKIPRRKFLQWLGRISLLWGLSAAWANIIEYLPVGSSKEQDAAKRITARIIGISTDFHPENAGVFFRNVVMATKMLAVASEMKDHNGGQLPKLAFQVERGHSGIEDFLQVGADACRNLILIHPKAFLKEAVSVNGGIEKFCTARLFKLPKNFRTVGGRIPDDVVRLITERKVIDTKLQEGLEKILTG